MRDGKITISINGRKIEVRSGLTVAAAMLQNGVDGFRTSVTGESRGPLCGMGICFECRATIDEIGHTRTCVLPVVDGMEIRTD